MPDPVLDLDGAAAIPRSNGEPVFSAPWQSRAFGMAMALHEQGAFEWERFRELLIDEIARREAEAGGPAEAIEDLDGSFYYASWTRALARVLDERELIPASELAGRELAFRSGVRRDVF